MSSKKTVFHIYFIHKLMYQEAFFSGKTDPEGLTMPGSTFLIQD